MPFPDNNTKIYIIKTLLGKRCNCCFSDYRNSDVLITSPFISDKFKQSLSKKEDYSETIIADYNYISKHSNYIRDRMAVYKDRQCAKVYEVNILCSNCGDIRTFSFNC